MCNNITFKIIINFYQYYRQIIQPQIHMIMFENMNVAEKVVYVMHKV
jgi:hypothetical protein